MKQKYSIGDVVVLKDSLNRVSLGKVKKTTLRTYYIVDLNTFKTETYNRRFGTLSPNYSTTGYDKYITGLNELKS